MTVVVHGELRTELVVHLHHGAGEAAHLALVAPHRVTSQLLLEHRSQVEQVDQLQLVMARVPGEEDESINKTEQD